MWTMGQANHPTTPITRVEGGHFDQAPITRAVEGAASHTMMVSARIAGGADNLGVDDVRRGDRIDANRTQGRP